MSEPAPVYVLDANVFVQAHRHHYAFEICPGFWDCLVHHHQGARIGSIDRIRAEIVAGDEDALEIWVKTTAPKTLFASTGVPTVVGNFAAMVQWVEAQPQFKREAKDQFAQVADGWLAAFAKSRLNHVVVTHEELSLDAKKRVPLPNVCKQFGVEYIDTFTMPKRLKARFEWVKI